MNAELFKKTFCHPFCHSFYQIIAPSNAAPANDPSEQGSSSNVVGEKVEKAPYFCSLLALEVTSANPTTLAQSSDCVTIPDLFKHINITIKHFHVTSLPPCCRTKTIHFSPLGNKIYFHAKLFHCFSPPTWLP